MKKFSLFFNNSEDKDKLSYEFPVEIETHAHGEVVASCPAIPGARAQGRNEREALTRLRAWMGRYFQSAAAAPFERSEIFPDQPKIYSLIEHRGFLYASTNRDTVLKSGSGAAGSWKPHPVTRTPSRFFNPSVHSGLGTLSGIGRPAVEDDGEAGDYVTQIYCLARYAPLGQEVTLFAGTNLNGSVFRSDDGETWREAFATGEDRVHALCMFRDKLYAGTSSEGRVYAYDGSQWNAVGALNETAVTALGSFGGYLWAGTYPSGLLFASSNGFAWEEVAPTGHAFVQCFKEFKGAFYAGCSSTKGAAVLRTRNGRDWETVYESPRELNIFCLEVFDGQLWAGTGNSGRVLATRDGATWHTLFAGDDEGVRAMVVYDDFLWAGTENGGAMLKSTRDSAQLPRVEDIHLAEVTSSTAVLTWETDLTCISEVQYAPEPESPEAVPEAALLGLEAGAVGNAGDYPFSVQDRIPKRRHRIKLAGLKAGMKYRYRVVCLNRRSSATVVDRLSFATPAVTRPKIDSTTHPDNGLWSRMDSPEIHLFSEGRVAGWRWVLDREPATIPERPRAEFTESGRVSLSRLSDGPWWFHAVSVDENGNPGEEAAHYPLLIDTQAPPPVNLRSPTHPTPGDWRADSSPVAEWDAPDDLSGVKGYYVKVDRDPGTVPGPQDGVFTVTPRHECAPLEDGVWYVHVTTLDEAGNLGGAAAHLAVRIDTQATAPLLTSPTHPREDKWYPVMDARVDWAPPHDLSGVDGFLWVLDRESKTLPAEGTAEFTPRPHLDLPGLDEGLWYVHVRTRDAAGNLSRDASHMGLRVDTTADPPWLESPTHPEDHRWYNKRGVVMTWKDPKDDSGVEGYLYAVNQEPMTVPSAAAAVYTQDRSLSFEVPKDGLWWFHVVMKDRAGNVGKRAAHFPVRVDTSVDAPRLRSRTHPDPELWTNQTEAVVQFDPPEDLSGIAAYLYYITEEEAAPFDPRHAQRTAQPSIEVHLPHDGVHWFVAVCEDTAGNVSRSPARLKMRVDTTAAPPLLQSPTHPEPSRWYASRKFEVYLTDPEDLSGIDGYYVLFNRDEAWAVDYAAMRYTQARGSTVTVPSDGVWWAHVVTKDKAGNPSQPARIAFRVDSAAYPPPVSSPTHPPQRWSRDPRARFTWTHPPELSGVEGYYVILDRKQQTIPTPDTGSWIADSEWSSEPLEDGAWWFHIAAKDKVGNVSLMATHYGFLVDAAAPVTRLKALPEWQGHTGIPLSWESKDDSSGVDCYDVQVREGDGPWTDWKTGIPEPNELFQGRDGVRYAFRVRARDKVGNLEPYGEIGDSVAYTTVDLSPPPPVAEIKARPRPKGDIELSWQPVEDLVSGTSFYRVYRWLEGEAKRCISRDGEVVAPSFLDPGTGLHENSVYYYAAKPVDRLGNERDEGNAVAACLSDQSVGTPLVTSPTHPAGVWSSNPDPLLTWLAPADASGVEGYYHLCDRDPQGKPGPDKGSFTRELNVQLSGLGQGNWWFHLAALDRAGNVTEIPAHYQLCVDSGELAAPDVTSPTHVDPKHWSTTGDVTFRLMAASKPSGIEGFYWLFDRNPETKVAPSAAQRTSEGEIRVKAAQAGAWHLHVAARDHAGNLSPTAHRQVLFTGGEIGNPELSSPTHPEGRWSSNAAPLLAWKAPPNPEGVEGFYYSCDRNPMAQPGPGNGILTKDLQVQLTGLAAGEWWFHLSLRDKAGHMSPAPAHWRLCVDADPMPEPKVDCPSHPVPERWYASPDVKFHLTAAAKPSGLEAFYYLFDRNAETRVEPSASQRTTEAEISVRVSQPGRWYLHAAVRDHAGNLSPTAHREILTSLGEPLPPVVNSPSHPKEDEPKSDPNLVFTWEDRTDAEMAPQGYAYRLSNNESETLTPEDAVTTERTVKLSNAADGTWWFHIAGLHSDGRPGSLTSRRKAVVKRVGRVAGKFMSKDGQSPMVGVPVEAWRGEIREAMVPTRPDGIFIFENLPEGKYEIRLNVPNQPPLRLPGVGVGIGVPSTPMILSDDAGVFPNPPPPGPVRFYYLLKEDCAVLIEIFNDKGQLIERLMDKKPGGAYNMTVWDATGRPEGIYQYKLTAKSLTRSALSRYTVKKFKMMRPKTAEAPAAAPAPPPPAD